jgi:trk system potassium uptake protein TrkA
MNILVIGCGRVGASLAVTLDKKGHDVSVIDRNSEKFAALGSDFGGFTTTGVAIDRDALNRAGIQTCDVLFAVTDEDDINIMAAQLAKQLYNVPKIYTRIDDIGKSEVFEEFGLETICPTKLTVSAACAAVEDEEESAEVNFSNHTVLFSTVELPEHFIGKSPSDIKYERGEKLFGIIRQSSGFMLYGGEDIEFAEGDKLIFAEKA